MVSHGQPPFATSSRSVRPFSRRLWRGVASSGAGFWLLTMASWRRFLHVKIAEMGHKIASLLLIRRCAFRHIRCIVHANSSCQTQKSPRNAISSSTVFV
ncbi:unnamed protein product [Jaminaea pallidilutea]